MTASATHIAALKVRDKALEVAGRTVAGRARRARHRRRRGGAQGRQSAGPSISLGTIAQHLAPTAKTLRRPRAGPCRRRLVQDRPSGLSLWQPRRRGAGRSARPAASRSSAISSPTTSAAPSIRCWSRARSSAASLKGWAARCSRNSPTASAAIRSPSPSPIISCRPCTKCPRPTAAARGLHLAAQSARHQRRRRKRHHRRRRRHRLGHRRRHRHARRGARLPVTPQRLKRFLGAR